MNLQACTVSASCVDTMDSRATRLASTTGGFIEPSRTQTKGPSHRWGLDGGMRWSRGRSTTSGFTTRFRGLEEPCSRLGDLVPWSPSHREHKASLQGPRPSEGREAISGLALWRPAGRGSSDGQGWRLCGGGGGGNDGRWRAGGDRQW
ncbi:hypothetical protein CRG98_008281 [Punica granatum]|uniref:Uncharacterized protein n=1 Tax=Punica granatum TaxID=22663 RepID=A0A2I0KS34_PUNGR|nr:hypothetical protein CRG98_008281 [Punica granatum]